METPWQHKSGLEIAVIGMSCRFPGAHNIEEFWENICDGKESISFFTDQELQESGVPLNVLEQPNYVKARGILEDVDKFDANFFGINPSEAEIIDPQQRVFLECAWHALENAGYNPHSYTRPIGLFAGEYDNSYQERIYSKLDINERMGDFIVRISNEKDYLTTRVAYHLKLRGPVVTVQTACSTSLVAVHLACQSLLNGSCDIALAGGVTVRADERTGYLYQEAGTLSPNGHCRPFDASAHGFVSSNGVGVVVMKRLEDAIADNDTIYGVIKGSAINNDGSDKVGYSAPSVRGQADVISSALAMAEIDPSTISYIEAHGSATLLGDPIEINALREAFTPYTSNKGFCAIGSVKGNIGHVHVAAGIAGLIKTLLALTHKTLPPSINYIKPNPNIDFDNTPFYVNTEKKEWLRINEYTPRRAGVSAFGIGGTNGHVVLEEAPEDRISPSTRPWHLITMSAKSLAALEDITTGFTNKLKHDKDIDLANAAYTLSVGRKTFEYKRMFVCKDREDAIAAIEYPNQKRLLTSQYTNESAPIIFMFPGLGDHCLNMGLEFYHSEPVYRDVIDKCSEILYPMIGRDIRQVIYSEQKEHEKAAKLGQVQGLNLARLFSNRDNQSEELGELNRTSLAQPAVFITEYALAQLWMSWGIQPQALIGFSIGEYVSACLAEVFSLEDALFLIANRARLIEDLPSGAMLAVLLSQEEISTYLSPNVSLAAINGPSICVVAGPNEDIASLENTLADKNIATRQIRTSHAFHSKMMLPIMEESANLVKKISVNSPKLPYVSTVTGDWVLEKDAIDPDYWARHMCDPVLFYNGIKRAFGEGGKVLIEIGPGQALSSLAMPYTLGEINKRTTILQTMKNQTEQKSDYESSISALGKLWLSGIQIDRARVYKNETRKRISLPDYPFERNRYWLERTGKADPRLPNNDPTIKKENIDDWFYVPIWKQSINALSETSKNNSKAGWLFFLDELGIGEEVIKRVCKSQDSVTTVIMGKKFRKLTKNDYAINSKHLDDYINILRNFLNLNVENRTLVYLWPVSYPKTKMTSIDIENDAQICFHNLILLAKAISYLDNKTALKIILVSNNLHAITGSEILSPGKSVLIGPAKSLSQELLSVKCKVLDLDLSKQISSEINKIVNLMAAELLDDREDSLIAYRGNRRWICEYESIKIKKTADVPGKLKDGGIYLITGGLGALGLKIAEYLAISVRARIILISRTEMPARKDWGKWLTTHASTDNLSIKIKAIEHIIELGGEVLLFSADITNHSEIKKIISSVKKQFGQINGVFHAAGIAGGGMMQLKAEETANRVLAPKVKGIMVLYECLKRTEVEFFVLFSSTFSITGGFGQSDYSSANAFLDAFSHYVSSLSGPYTVSINWDAWKQGGMAYNNLVGKYSEVEHVVRERSNTSDTFTRIFNPSRDWLLDEHRMLGKAMIPGTAYLEMVRNDMISYTLKGKTFEFVDVTFLSPVVFETNEDKEIQTVLTRISEDEYEFSCLSRLSKLDKDDKENRWQKNVIGKVVYAPQGGEKQLDIKKLISKHNLSKVSNERLAHLGPMKFGPRSLCLKDVYIGQSSALALLELPSIFAGDLELIKLHPALLDIATGFVNLYLNQDAFFMPLSYKKISIHHDIPSQIISYVQYLGDQSIKNKETLSFDIIILDKNGIEILTIEDFTMKKVENLPGKLRDWSSLPIAGTDHVRRDSEVAPTNIFKRHYDTGLLPVEGVEALHRILAHNILPQVVVATKDFKYMCQEIDSFTLASLNESSGAEISNKSLHPRPNITTSYIAPKSLIEKRLAEMWQELLGIQNIGIEDNFFDLGGHSLLGVQLVSKIRTSLNLDLPLRSIFEHPTIATLALNIKGLPKRAGGSNGN